MEKSEIDDKTVLEKRITMSSLTFLKDIFAQILKRKLSDKPINLPTELKEADNANNGES